jgi:hypothetical protein
MTELNDREHQYPQQVGMAEEASPTSRFALEELPDRPLSVRRGDSPDKFDKKVELDAYGRHLTELESRLYELMRGSSPEPLRIHDPAHQLVLSSDELERVWGLFPRAARERAAPVLVESGPSLWFYDLSCLPIKPTAMAERAVLLTGFILGGTRMHDGGTATISLRHIPENIGFSHKVQKIAQTRAVAHELAHTVVNKEGNSDGTFFLRLENGRTMSVVDFHEKLAHMAYRYGPISCSSAPYHEPNGALKSTELTDSDMAVSIDPKDIALSEETCELIAAYLLGYTVMPDGVLVYDPFRGRRDQEILIRDYLNAQRIS